MSQAGKFRPNGSVNTSNNNDKISMPSSASLSSSSPVTGVKNNNMNSRKDTTALNGTSLTQGSEVSAGAGTPRPESLITLDVLLPSGQHTDITVDWSTPMLDLLVSLAGKCRVNPTGLSLQLLDPDTRLPLTYKPNQTIGSLGGREVRLVPRDESSNKTKSKGDRKQEKPFEITHRFTMNLPRGQKTVVRVSPLITLGQLMTTVCEDKSLDLRRHVLQIPGQPGIKVDLGSTIQELGLNELSLVAVGLQDPRSHMVSMPDLSKPPPSSTAPPSYMPMAGEFKKKRGFLSFLSKNKDKKYRTQNMETSSTTSHMARNPYPPTSRQATTPPAERREFSEAPHRPHHPESRPKTMFVTAAPQQAAIGDEHSKHPTQHQLQQQDQTVDITAGTAKKKRRAPAPPGPSSTLSLPSIPSMVPSEEISQAVNGGHSVSVSPPHKEQQQTSRAELLSRLHSRNSSDSSGYHELTLSGAESPEAPGHLEHHTQQQAVAKLKSSIDTTSIESGQDGSGANGDSGIHDQSPTRVSPIKEVIEKPNQTGTSVETSMSIAKKSVTATASGGVGGKKKRKAPAPPVSAPSLQPLISSEMANLAFSSENQTTSETAISEMKPDGAAERTLSRDAAEEIYEKTSPQEASTPRQSDNDELDTHSEKQDFAIQDNTQGNAVVNDLRAIADSHDNYDLLNADKHSDDEDAAEINTAFDIDAILEGVVFDEEPKPMELQVVGSSNHEMVMEETGSIISETVEQVESDRHERPCAFIPPPPPDEPPPPEVEPVQHIIGLTRKEPVLVDKGTGVNEDNTSLAPSSAKSSPGAGRKRRASHTSLGSVDTIEGLSMDFEQAIQMGEESLYLSVDDVTVPTSYKNEMALFVERMSKMAVETTSGRESGQQDDSVSSLSLPASENSDTGSVIQHIGNGSQDSRESGWDGDHINGTFVKNKDTLPMSEEISVPIETVPPPPEFGDDGGEQHKESGKKEEEEEEEYFTETVEELIVPLTSEGYDFSAAQSLSSETKISGELTPHEERERSSSTGVFRAELVSIAPVTTTTISSPGLTNPPVATQQTVSDMETTITSKSQSSPEQPTEKEEFVLTTEDLSNVSFLPPKPKMAKAMPIVNKPESSVSSGFVSSTALVLERQGMKSPRSQNVTNFTLAEPEDSAMVTKPLSSLQYLPTMRAGEHAEITSISTFSDDSRSEDSNTDPSLDPLVNKLSPHLLVDSSSQPNTIKQRSSSDHSNIASRPSNSSSVASATAALSYTALDNHTPVNCEAEERHSPIQDMNNKKKVVDESLEAGAELDPQEALANQYAALQSQFAQWQTQLSQNQALLAAQTSPGISRANQAAPEIQAEQLQQLSDQVLAQQQMMQQLQQTMQALQQQQQLKGAELNGREQQSTPVLTPSQVIPQPPPPPPPSVDLPQAAKSYNSIPKVKTLDSPKPAKPAGRQSQFGPVLDPREELMLAIRGFKGREGLRSVPVQQTKWVHSNR